MWVRVLIVATTPDFINRVLDVKVNGTVYSIRILEESFGEKYNRFPPDWKYQLSAGSSSENDESVERESLVVSETELDGVVGE